MLLCADNVARLFAPDTQERWAAARAPPAQSDSAAADASAERQCASAPDAAPPVDDATDSTGSDVSRGDVGEGSKAHKRKAAATEAPSQDTLQLAVRMWLAVLRASDPRDQRRRRRAAAAAAADAAATSGTADAASDASDDNDTDDTAHTDDPHSEPPVQERASAPTSCLKQDEDGNANVASGSERLDPDAATVRDSGSGADSSLPHRTSSHPHTSADPERDIGAASDNSTAHDASASGPTWLAQASVGSHQNGADHLQLLVDMDEAESSGGVVVSATHHWGLDALREALQHRLMRASVHAQERSGEREGRVGPPRRPPERDDA